MFKNWSEYLQAEMKLEAKIAKAWKNKMARKISMDEYRSIEKLANKQIAQNNLIWKNRIIEK